MVTRLDDGAPATRRQHRDTWVVDPAKLRALRQQRGLNQPQLSQRAGVRQQHISTLEGRPTRVRVGTLIRLAEALGVSPGVLLTEQPAADDLRAATPTLQAIASPSLPDPEAGTAGEAGGFPAGLDQSSSTLVDLAARLERFSARLDMLQQLLADVVNEHRSIRQALYSSSRLADFTSRSPDRSKDATQ